MYGCMLDSLGCCQPGVTRAGRPVRFAMQFGILSPFLESYVLVRIKCMCKLKTCNASSGKSCVC